MSQVKQACKFNNFLFIASKFLLKEEFIVRIFLSWSGEHSCKFAEAFRNWLSVVLQGVKPYFTPSDIEKGTRWITDISKELSESQFGILCITRENIHSEWIHFEAGALAKNLDKSNVCPILFGISNTDITGPLKQFQTTEFKKEDMLRLFTLINNRLGEQKLSQKTLDMVFEKWWPDLELQVQQILDEAETPDAPIRTDREILEEILQLSRVVLKHQSRANGISPAAVKELLTYYIELHDDQVAKQSDYQGTLLALKKMHNSVGYISQKFKGFSEEIDKLLGEFLKLSYSTESDENLEKDDSIPF